MSLWRGENRQQRERNTGVLRFAQNDNLEQRKPVGGPVQTADPSTPLRSGRDDIFYGVRQRAGLLIEDRWKKALAGIFRGFGPGVYFARP
jgi:hypothetical protein